MGNQAVLITIVGMAVVTIIPRILPVWLLARRRLPRLLLLWLKYVPVSVLAALVTPSVLIYKDRLDLTPTNPFLLAALPSLLVALRTRNLFATLLVGMAALALLRHFLPI